MKQQKQKRLRCVLALALALAVTGCGGSQASGSAQEAPAGSVAEPTPEPTPTPDPRIQFPCEVDGGKLTVNSLFQSSIFNPDCSDQSGEDIASLELVNTSDSYLEEAQFVVTLRDGTQINFAVSGVPAGQAVWAFATDNTALPADAVCDGIECTASYQPSPPLMEDKIAFAVSGTTITLTNLTGEDLTDLTVCCHCLLDGTIFGGRIYTYQVGLLRANGSATVEAMECYLGSADVVCIRANG